MKKAMTIFAALLVLLGCNSQKKADKMKDNKTKGIVLYYSQTGTTQKAAQEFAELLGADILRIETQIPYDGTYQETIARAQKEMADKTMPALKDLDTDLSGYDTIFLGYPIWFGTYALPIASLVSENDFAGKTIVPFCTFGSGGLEASTKDLRNALPKAEILEGYGVRTARIEKAPAEIDHFLKSNGYIEGEFETLPEYSEQKPVTEEEAAIFDAACSDYQYPLGTPVSAGMRTTSAGTDYCFTAKSKDAAGNDVTATIYVTVGKESGAKPEFTKVVR